MGVTFKENVTDTRNSKAGELAQELMASCGQVDVVDPLADAREVKAEYGFQLCEQMGSQYDAVVMAVSHEEYQSMNEADLLAISKEKAVFFDIKGIQRGKINTLSYLSL